MLGCLLIGLVLGYIYSKTRVPLYEGSATIDLNPSQTNMGLSDLIQESLSSEDVRLPTEVARMQSNLVVFDTIKELAQQHRGPFPTAFDGLSPDAGMEAFPAAKLQAMIGSVRGSLKVSTVTGTDIVAINYRDPRPQVAKDVPNTIVEVYLKRNLDDHMEGTGRVTRWLATEMEGLKQQATRCAGAAWPIPEGAQPDRDGRRGSELRRDRQPGNRPTAHRQHRTGRCAGGPHRARSQAAAGRIERS